MWNTLHTPIQTHHQIEHLNTSSKARVHELIPRGIPCVCALPSNWGEWRRGSLQPVVAMCLRTPLKLGRVEKRQSSAGGGSTLCTRQKGRRSGRSMGAQEPCGVAAAALSS